MVKVITYQSFLVLLLVVFLGAGLGSGAAFGFPTTFCCLRNSISSFESLNKLFTPIRLDGSYPCRLSLFLAASDVVLSRSAISGIDSSIFSIHLNISAKAYKNQGKKGKMSAIWTISLYNRIVKNQNSSKFCKISFQNLDSLLGSEYILYRLNVRQLDI